MPPLQTRIGAMRESLALQSNTLTTSTGTGFSTAGWATYATVQGEYLQPTGGREAFEGGAVTAELPPRFRIRYRSDVQPKHRAVWKGQTLEIHAVIPITNIGDRFLILQCGVTQ